MALSARQARFIAEYLRSHNATEAAKLAGYSFKTARSMGSRLLTQPAIAAKLSTAAVDSLEEIRGAEVTVSRVLEETAKLAYFDHDGISPNARFYQKVPALKLLASHLGMIQPPAQPAQANLGFQINIILGDYER